MKPKGHHIGPWTEEEAEGSQSPEEGRKKFMVLRGILKEVKVRRE